MTYADVDRLSAHAAYVLQQSGIQRGDRVGIVLPNVPAFVVWYYACLRLGAIAVSTSTRLSGEEIAFILSDCGAKVLIGADSDGLVDKLAGEMPDSIAQVFSVSADGLGFDGNPLTSADSIGEGTFVNTEPDDPATILYTSGTTGFPKGATLSHKNVRATMHAFNHLCGMQTDERLLLSVPLFHCFGQNALLNQGLNVGAAIVLQRRFDLIEAKRLIAEHQITMLFGVPTTFQLMLESCQPSDLASIRYCFSAAARMPEQIAERWREKFGMPVFEGYGLTETAPFASYNHRLQFVPGSIGSPVDLVEMKIVDTETGQECPPHTPGEIAIRGPNVMLGYWNRPEETEAAIRDGWFHSGDIGTIDENGYFYIVDRLKDMIVVSGLKVFPAEVERVLLDYEAVSEAAVVGFADSVLGEKVVAFVIPSAGTRPTPDEIHAYCKTHLGSYKVPNRIVFLDELPRNPSGKVLKTRLREMELAELDNPSHEIPEAGDSEVGVTVPALPAVGPLFEQLQAAHPASRERMLTTFLQEELKSLTGQSAVLDVDEPIINEDIDSLMIVEFRDRLQAQVGSVLQLPATVVFDHPKLADLGTHLLNEFEQQDSNASAVTRPQSQPVRSANQTMNVSAQPEHQANSAAEQTEPVDQMSEQEAMEALLREVNE